MVSAAHQADFLQEVSWIGFEELVEAESCGLHDRVTEGTGQFMSLMEHWNDRQ